MFDKINSKQFVKNSCFNAISQISPLFIIIFTTPYVISRLGVERYGIFALMRILVEYFTVFDFGLGGAGAKFIAEKLGIGQQEKAASIYWTSMGFIFFVGIIASALFYLFIPFLADHFFNIGKELIPEMKLVFRISSLVITVLLLKSVCNGILEAYQRFDLTNMVKIPLFITSSLLPAVVIYMGYGLSVIAATIVIVELLAFFVYYLLCLRIMPKVKPRLLDHASFKHILSFGFWLSTNRIIGWVMSNIQTIVIGSLVTLAAVTYYNVPYNLAFKMMVIGGSIMPVVFTATSLLNAVDKNKMKRLFSKTFKYTMSLYILPTIIFVFFAKEILVLWLGSDFQQSALILRFLALGMFMAGMGWVLGTFLQATGHAKMVTIIAACQMPFDILLTWFSVKHYGINGAAFIWCFMRGLTMVIAYLFCKRLYIVDKLLIINKSFAKYILGTGLVSALALILNLSSAPSLPNLFRNILIFVLGYLTVVWRYIVDTEQKEALSGIFIAK